MFDYGFRTSNTPANQTGNVAADSYHRYKEDIDLAADLGVHISRILTKLLDKRKRIFVFFPLLSVELHRERR